LSTDDSNVLGWGMLSDLCGSCMVAAFVLGWTVAFTGVFRSSCKERRVPLARLGRGCWRFLDL